MHCPFCGANDTKVIDSRLVAEGDQVRRRRECLASGCGERFTTFESAELVMPKAAFDEFCATNQVEMLPPRNPDAPQGDWDWRLADATHTRFK